MNLIDDKYQYSELTSKIIGAAMKVHTTLGMGFPEHVYKNSLLIELRKDKELKVNSEVEADVYYENQWVGTRRLDILVNEEVIVELKATGVIEQKFINQLLNYLYAFNIEVGLLINFGKERLEFKRYYNSKFLKK